MQSEVFHSSSTLIDVFQRSTHSTSSKKSNILNYYNFKSQKLLSSHSKFLPKHSKRFYSRLRPSKNPSNLFSSRYRSSSRQALSDRKLTSRSDSVREGKDELIEIENAPNYEIVREKLLNCLKKAKIMNKPQNPKISKPLTLESKLSQGSKSTKKKIKKIPGKGGKSSIKLFTSEFNSTIPEIDLAGSGYLNYFQYCKVLKNLRFIEDSFNKSEAETELVLKSWKLLSGLEDGKVRVEDLNYFLLAVLDVHMKPEPIFSQLSPQMKQKRSLVHLKNRKFKNIHEEFKGFYLHRTAPVETKNETRSDSGTLSQDISDSDTPDIVIEQAAILQPEIKEQIKEFHIVEDQNFLNSRLIRKITLRDLSITPNNMSPKLLSSNQSNNLNCETPQNISFDGSESNDLISKNSLNSPSTHDHKSSICKIEVRRISTKTDQNLSKDLNNSISYKSPSMKFKFPSPDDNSDSSILNMTEVHPTAPHKALRPKRIHTIAEGNQEDLRPYNKFLDSFAN